MTWSKRLHFDTHAVDFQCAVYHMGIHHFILFLNLPCMSMGGLGGPYCGFMKWGCMPPQARGSYVQGGGWPCPGLKPWGTGSPGWLELGPPEPGLGGWRWEVPPCGPDAIMESCCFWKRGGTFLGYPFVFGSLCNWDIIIHTKMIKSLRR